MRIAMFSDSYKPYISGVTNSIEILVKELRNLGHKVYIFAPQSPRHVDTDPDIIRFPSIPALVAPKFRLAIPYAKNVPQVDIIHTHSPFQAGLLASYVAHHRNIPLVYTFHTLLTRYVHYAPFIPEFLLKRFLVFYLRTYCSGLDAIICPSELAKRVLRRWRIPQRAEVIPSGVEMSLYPSSPEAARKNLRKKFDIPENAKVLIYIGRVSKEKNLSFLLRAFKRLGRDDVYLFLAGGGAIEKELKQAIKQQKNYKRIIQPGEINYPDVLSYYSIGDIFVFSSITETQGMVLAEAKAAGLPIVALFAGGLMGTVRYGIDGYLVPRNLDLFVEKLKLLLEDDALRKKMGEAAREDIVERFSSVVIAKKIESLYNSLIKGKGA